jgi:hypothetical protein
LSLFRLILTQLGALQLNFLQLNLFITVAVEELLFVAVNLDQSTNQETQKDNLVRITRDQESGSKREPVLVTFICKDWQKALIGTISERV